MVGHGMVFSVLCGCAMCMSCVSGDCVLSVVDWRFLFLMYDHDAACYAGFKFGCFVRFFSLEGLFRSCFFKIGFDWSLITLFDGSFSVGVGYIF